MHIRDKAGKRNGYFYGHDDVLFYIASPSTKNKIRSGIYVDNSGNYNGFTTDVGVYADDFSPGVKNVEIRSRYNSSYGTINGTYKVDVYKLTPPFTIFE